MTSSVSKEGGRQTGLTVNDETEEAERADREAAEDEEEPVPADD